MWLDPDLQLQESLCGNALDPVPEAGGGGISILRQEGSAGNVPGFSWLHLQSAVPGVRKTRWLCDGAKLVTSVRHKQGPNLTSRGSSSLTGTTLTITSLSSSCQPSVNRRMKLSSVVSESSCTYITSIPEGHTFIWLTASHSQLSFK